MENENLAEMVKETTTKLQDSSGALNETPPADRFQVRARSIETASIENLLRIEQIEDYTDPPDATRPLILRTPEGDFVIDGQHHISAAIARGETSIECEVDVVEEHNLTDLCLRKAGARSQTRGGRARYAELVRNANELERLLLSENSDLKSFGHGGRRFGEGFIGDSEKDIRTILEIRLSKSRTTINAYLAHGKYISDEALSVLIDGNKDKTFFEKIGRLKGRLLQRSQEEEKTPDEITAELSAFVRHCAENGIPEIPRAPQTPSQPNPDPHREEDDDDGDMEDNDPDQEEEQTESGQGNVDPIITLKRSTLEVSSRLSQRIEESNDATSLYEAVTEEIRALTEIATRIDVLTHPGTRDEAEAA